MRRQANRRSTLTCGTRRRQRKRRGSTPHLPGLARDRVTPLLSDSAERAARVGEIVDFTLLGQRFRAMSAGPP